MSAWCGRAGSEILLAMHRDRIQVDELSVFRPFGFIIAWSFIPTRQVVIWQSWVRLVVEFQLQVDLVILCDWYIPVHDDLLHPLQVFSHVGVVVVHVWIRHLHLLGSRSAHGDEGILGHHLLGRLLNALQVVQRNIFSDVSARFETGLRSHRCLPLRWSGCDEH